jgi:hypothetical protein
MNNLQTLFVARQAQFQEIIPPLARPHAIDIGPNCRWCGSTLDVAEVEGLGPLCLKCTFRALDSLLDLESRLLEGHGVWDRSKATDAGWKAE